MRKSYRILWILLLLVVCSLPMPVSAEPEITVQPEAGFQNKVKHGKGVPLAITLSNSGSDFSGDLVVEFMENYNLGGGRAVPITLASGETATIRFAVPGLSDMNMSGQQAQSIFLYEGGWEKGESIDFQGSDTLNPLFIDPAAHFIGTLTENEDRLLPLQNALDNAGGETEVFNFNQLDGFQFPTDPTALESLDYLLIDEFAYDTLSIDAQQTVLQWIREGGKAVFGSGSVSGTAGNLTDYLPLSLTGPASLTVRGFDQPVPGFSALLNEGATVLAGSEGQPAVAVRQIGAGAVIQTAFSVGDETITGDSGYATFMKTILNPDQSYALMTGDQSIQDRIVYEIGRVNELFESFAVSLPLAATIVLIYIILAVPVLYAVLKRKDRREYAWLLIPSLAIAVSILLFAAGAKDRIGNPQIQQTGFFEISEDGGLNGYFMNSLLSNRGGDYRFEAPAGTELSSSLTGLFGDRELHQTAMVEKSVNQTDLVLRDMRYWSVASVIGQTYIEQAGGLEADLKVESGRLTGMVRNDFPFAVEGAAVWSGTQLLEIGSLSPGEELAVNESVQSKVLAPASPIGQNYSYQPVMVPEDIIPARKQAVLSVAYDQLAAHNDPSVYLIGYTREAIAPAELEEQQANISAVNLLLKPIAPKIVLSGNVELDSASFQVNVTAKNPAGFFDVISEVPPVYFMEDGMYELTYTLPDTSLMDRLTLSELAITGIGQGMQTAILNRQSGEFEALDAGQHTFGAEARNYVSETGGIVLELEIRQSEMMSPEITLPQLSLKGAVTE